MPIINRVADLETEIAAWRQDFHAHPELQYDVPRTAGRVAEMLRGNLEKIVQHGKRADSITDYFRDGEHRHRDDGTRNAPHPIPED